MPKHIDLNRQRKRLLALSKAKGLTESDRVYLSRMVGWVQPVYDYETDECEYGTLERSGSSIYGCPWTPPTDGGAICQLDLDEIRTVTGRDFGSGLLVFLGGFAEREAEETPSESYDELISREEIEKTGKPEPFLGANLTPLEYFEGINLGGDEEDHFFYGLRDLFGNELANLNKPNAEYELLRQVDPQRARDMWIIFEMAMEQAIKDATFHASISNFAPAIRIVNWVESSDEYYGPLAETTDSEILDNWPDESPDLRWFMGAGDGLFKWPFNFPDYWRDAKAEAGAYTPFFTLDGGGYGMEDWEFLYRETVNSTPNEKRFDFKGFGLTGGRYGRDY